jgi:transcriptional regulator GlxA family with amidase domain
LDSSIAQAQHIDLLILPETNLILVASVIEPLRAANRIAGRTLYSWSLFSPDGRAIETKSGIPVPVAGAFRPQRETAPLFVLSSYHWQRSATSQLKMLLSQTARHREMMAGIESGSWLLAETSLLDNFSATTHWEDFEDFAAAYPQVTMVRERFVIDRKRITTGGSLPTLDLMLELIRRAHGYSLALEVSRLFIYEQERTRGDLLQVPAIGNMRILDTRVGAAVKLMEETVEAPLTLARLARRVGGQRPASSGSLQGDHGRRAARTLSGAAAQRRAAQGHRNADGVRRHSGDFRLQLVVFIFAQLSRALSGKPQRDAPAAQAEKLIQGLHAATERR